MKKKLLYLLFVSAAILIVAQSCKKDVVFNEQKDNLLYTPEAMRIYKQLVNFKYNLDNPTRDNQSMTVDSAVWYLEALFNVNNAFADSTFGYLISDTSYYQLSINDSGLIELSDISLVYDLMVLDLNNILNQINNDVKFLYAGNLENNGINGSTLNLLLFNNIGINILAMYEPFEEEDDWRYGNGLGKCYIPGFTSDAVQELEWRLDHPYFASPIPGNTWISQQIKDAWWWEYPINNNPYGDYRIFYDGVSQEPPCLENYMLDYYLTNAHQIIYTVDDPNTPELEGERPEGKDFIDVFIWSNNLGTTPFYHNYAINYGIKVYIQHPIE